MPRQKSTPKTMFSARIPPDLREQVQEVAQIRDRPVSWVVERALEEYCRRELRGKSAA